MIATRQSEPPGSAPTSTTRFVAGLKMQTYLCRTQLPNWFYQRAILQQGALQDVAQAISEDARVFVIVDEETQEAAERTGRYARVTEAGAITGERAGRFFSMRIGAEEMVGRI